MMPGVSVELVVDSRAVTSEASGWPDRAKATVITDSASYMAACELLKGIKALRAKIAETFDPHIKRAYDAHTALCKEKRTAEAPLTEAEGVLKRLCAAYDDAQERLRVLEEQRLQALAREDEERRRLNEAAALEREGNATGDATLVDEAHALLEQPIEATTVLAERTIPKVAGISYRDTWSARVVSLPKLIAYVAAHPQHANLLVPNQAALNSLARSLKGGMAIDGVSAVCQKITAASGR